MESGAAGRVVVTGASGFVGQHTMNALRAAGFVCDVAPAAHDLLSNDESTASIARSQLAQACRGACILVHLAGRAHVLSERGADPEALFMHSNADLVDIVLEAACGTAVRRAVLASSVAAVGSSSERPLTERSACAPQGAYGRSKLEGERRFAARCAGAGIAGTIVRMPMIYGPAMKGNPLRLLSALERGVPLPLGSMRGPRSVVYVGNVAAAIVWIAVAERAAAGVYNITDADSTSTAQFAAELALAIGKRARLIPIPPAILALMMRTLRHVPLCGSIVSLASHLYRAAETLEMDSSAIAHDIGFSPPISRVDGMRETARWFHAQARVDMAAH